jgi:hypothetical protein
MLHASTWRRNIDKLQPLFYPTNAAIEVVQSDRQPGIIGVQPGDFSFEPTEANNDFVQFLALRRLLGADRAEHGQNQIGSLVAQDFLPGSRSNT